MVTLLECLAVADGGSDPITVLNGVSFLYHGTREDRVIEPRGIIAAFIGLVCVAALRLGSGVDASQLPTQFVYFGFQGKHLRLPGINPPALSLRHHVLVLVPRHRSELTVSDPGMLPCACINVALNCPYIIVELLVQT